MLCLSDITIITVKGIDYRCVIHDISKFDANHLLEKSLLDDHEYIYITRIKEIDVKNRLYCIMSPTLLRMNLHFIVS